MWFANELRTGQYMVLIPAQATEFSSPQRPGRLWDPPNLLFNGYRNQAPVVKRPESGAGSQAAAACS
jgi:hypothetical protein